MNDTEEKTIKIAKNLQYEPIKQLDLKRPYVFKIRKNNKFYVLKTDHFEDEAAILKILNQKIDMDSFFNKNIIIPKLYEHSRKYLVEDFLDGKKIKIDNFNIYLNFIYGKIIILHQFLNNIEKLSAFTKDEQDLKKKKNISSSIWLKTRIKRWFSKKQSRPDYIFPKNLISPAIKYCLKIKNKCLINFGCFSAKHFRIYPKKLGIFDFGQHLRYAPVNYDWAYLWWGFFIHDATKYPLNYWKNLLDRMVKYSQNEREFYACIIERLAGISKDLTVMQQENIIGNKIIEIQKIRNKILQFILDKK